jgi:ubiquinone/menaquinone biosynthesis C-methylase UbiE
MSLFVPKRIDTPELLDEENAPYHDVVRSLEDLRRFNSYAGGVRAYRALLRRLAGDRLPTAKIVDIGTGTSDLLESLKGRDSRMGVAIGTDIKFEHLLYGKQTGAQSTVRIAADAFHLPLKDDAIDIVTSSHFFHHFSAEQNIAIAREALRIARIGIVFTDTRRNWMPLLFVHLLGALRIVGRITRFDAPASVLRGYTLSEVRAIAGELGSMRIEVIRVMPFRFALLVWKNKA